MTSLPYFLKLEHIRQMTEIMKGNEVPKGRQGPWADYVEVFPRMDVGDSVDFPLGKIVRRRVLSAASHWKRAHPGWNYTTRTLDGGLRLWRTE